MRSVQETMPVTNRRIGPPRRAFAVDLRPVAPREALFAPVLVSVVLFRARGAACLRSATNGGFGGREFAIFRLPVLLFCAPYADCPEMLRPFRSRFVFCKMHKKSSINQFRSNNVQISLPFAARLCIRH
jgi:hypothetical protein